MEKFYLSTPIYYASGNPHVGHAFATIYADIVARYKRKNNFDVFFSTGLDEHGSKIEDAANKQNMEAGAFVDQISNKYLNLWDKLDINYSEFIRTSSLKHKKIVEYIINRLFETGDIYLDTYEGLYCTGCETFITEKDLINGLCPNHLKEPINVKEKNYFFNLKKYLPKVREAIVTNTLLIRPESRKNEAISMIDNQIPNFSITREKVNWGIPLPQNTQQTIYVWVEALMNYLTVIDYPNQKFSRYWPADLHIIGAEINKFHSIYWPALLMSLELSLPREIFVHGLFTINSQKMSKSLGNIIDPLDMIEKFGSDATRYLLISQFSAYEHGDIKESEFIIKYNADLANGVGNLFERIFTLLHRNRENFSLSSTDKDTEMMNLLYKWETRYIENMEKYELFDAFKVIMGFMKNIDIYINIKKPWAMIDVENQNDLNKVLDTLFYCACKVRDWAEPFLPRTVSKIDNFIVNFNRDQVKQKLHLFPRLNILTK